ncbi:hypothetical protein N7490_005311 [Penicillium lividum]|nr:hypothetical protein N7490_005311 [Penicillium lividum]
MTIVPSTPLDCDSTPTEVYFFSSFHGFDHQPDNPVSMEFYRLAEWRHWKNGSKKWRKNWNRCIYEHYDLLIGDRVNDLRTWQQMCHKLDLPGDLPSITKCRKALSHVYVNIIDLLECWEEDRSPRRFNSCKELSNYTMESTKFFGRSIAKQDKVLKTLLRKVA